MSKHILAVLSNAVEGQDSEFNDWYTNTHVGDIVALPGYTSAQRFKLSDAQMGSGELPYQYLAIYEVEADTAADEVKALNEGTRGGMVISPALDMGRTVAWFYTPITDRVAQA